ncbi:unnamed protein product, partial [Darwinula stevensoni]
SDGRCWSCNPGFCIPSSLTCDEIKDCPDGSDENFCSPATTALSIENEADAWTLALILGGLATGLCLLILSFLGAACFRRSREDLQRYRVLAAEKRKQEGKTLEGSLSNHAMDADDDSGGTWSSGSGAPSPPPLPKLPPMPTWSTFRSLPDRHKARASDPRASDPGFLDANPRSTDRPRRHRFPYGSAPNVSPPKRMDPGSTEVITFTAEVTMEPEPGEEISTADITDDDQMAQSHL